MNVENPAFMRSEVVMRPWASIRNILYSRETSARFDQPAPSQLRYVYLDFFIDMLPRRERDDSHRLTDRTAKICRKKGERKKALAKNEVEPGGRVSTELE